MKKITFLIILVTASLSFCSFYIPNVLRHRDPKLKSVEVWIPLPNLEVKNRGWEVKSNIEYYNKVIYVETKWSEGWSIKTKRDTTYNWVWYITYHDGR